MNKIPLYAALLVAPVALVAGADGALARGKLLTDWQGVYPDSQSDDNVISGTGKSCQLCHQSSSGGDGWNGYGWDFKMQLDAGAGAADAIMNIQGLDSDLNGDSNLAEITDNAQPGWTEGANNTIYFKDGSTVDGQLPPGGVANLDPGGANAAPTADAGGPYSGTVDVAVDFDGSGSTDPDGTVVAYDWDFGDGNSGTGATPSHSYGAGGTYTVVLTVTDDLGATDTDTTNATIGVGNQAPTADAGGPYSGDVGVAIAFDGSGSTDPDGTIVAYDWDFGDGGTDTGATPSYAYGAAGTYNVTLTVTDDAGATDSASTTASVADANGPPAAPSNLTADLLTEGKGKNKVVIGIVLNWTDNADNEDNFVIQRCTVSGKGKNKHCSFADIGSVGANVTAFEDGPAGGTVNYRIRATNGNGDSDYSNEVQVRG
jgi:PKD repeat protein